MTDRSGDLTLLTAACLRRVPAHASSFREDGATFADDLTALVNAIKTIDTAYAFDSDGRPGAIAAIRRALPVMEAELFDAVLEDVGCELAARQEALYRLALAARSSST